VTDGTAVFKAVSVSGQIAKLSKTEVLISNSGDAYSTTKAYAVGEYCIHDDKLYRCITPCSAGSWSTNQSCFTQDTLVNVTDRLSGYISNKIAKIQTAVSFTNGLAELNLSGVTTGSVAIIQRDTGTIPHDILITSVCNTNNIKICARRANSGTDYNGSLAINGIVYL
jgi:hypothetical protein